MGYDVWGHGEFTMKAEQLKNAIPLIVKTIAEQDEDKTSLEASEKVSEKVSEILAQDSDNGNGVTTQKVSAVLKILPKLIESALDEKYECDIDALGDLTLRVSDDSFRNSDDEIWFFEVIAPF